MDVMVNRMQGLIRLSYKTSITSNYSELSTILSGALPVLLC
ncbi:hypothetical protein XIS1_130019 [Xenorhabdus innexi]|uniref:Uncharacterized protein n=1 Tax=Xenorhabdus innexi TaxID=290109 RepID=A0A1N6MSY8_9GAMM|nr:hypothetical protein XIS1_130019 [Xenorhabdus innexi]